MTNKKAFSEVIESSLSTFRAQCWEWDKFPAFGSLVQIKDNNSIILGCVTAIETGSMDPMRYPFPFQKTEQELKKEQPQIFEFLKTIFTVVALGYKKEEKLYHLLPEHPAKIHAFVSPCDDLFTGSFYSSPDFLYLLFSSQQSISHFDELLLTIFRRLQVQNKLTKTVLQEFCDRLSLLTGNDYRRMKLFLKRAENLI